MTSHPSTDATQADDDLFFVDATDVRIPDGMPWREPTPDFIASVRRNGVLVPILVTHGPDATLVLLTGLRRTVSARIVGCKLPVRLIRGTPSEQLLAAFNESFHRKQEKEREKAVERARQVAAYREAAKAEGRCTSVRALAHDLSVGSTSVENWLLIERGLGEDRLDRLADLAGVEHAKARKLSVRAAMRLARTKEDSKACEILKEIAGVAAPKVAPAPPAPPPGAWARLRSILQRIIGWIVSLFGWIHRRRHEEPHPGSPVQSEEDDGNKQTG